MASVRRYVRNSLRLSVNPLKSALDRPWKRSYLGFTITRTGRKLKVADKAIAKLKDRVRFHTRRTRDKPLSVIVAELRKILFGWKAYFGINERMSPLRDIDKGVRRKLRCYIWKQEGRSGYRNLRKRGLSVRNVWNMAKSAHSPGPCLHTTSSTWACRASRRGREFNSSNRRGR